MVTAAAAGASRRWGKIALRAAQIVCATHLVLEHAFSIHLCGGMSMWPTIMPRGDWVLQERLSFLFSRTPPLKRGELVAYLKPTDPSAVVLKRVAALEGDTVLVDPTGWSGDHEKTREVRIPKGHVWLLGDNPEASIDSREYGPVPIGLVKGRIVAKVFPSPEILLPRSS